ncbi:sensitivity to high expression protein she9 [Coemansia sp. BCRC 34301]|nr:sensitivity to high expression protein she9 [Coemansia sp. BCRC 34301]
MLAPTGCPRSATVLLCAVKLRLPSNSRIGNRLSGRARRYASSADDDSIKEPVESVLHRILDPAHAKSIGVAPSQQSTADSTKALVPMNIIYLPPPKWHKPLQPLPGHPVAERPVAERPVATPGMDSTESKPKASDETRCKQAEKGSGDNTHRAGAFHWLVGRLFTRAEQTTKTSQVSVAATAAAEAASEKWRHTVESARLKVDALRQLPKDDDWTTWLGKALNHLTGYDRIALHKQRVDDTGDAFQKARRHLDSIKIDHAKVIQTRMSSQREINSLLQRKHLWNEDDVARFTGLYRDEHQAETLEHSAAQELKNTEALVDKKYDELVAAIRERYHEEQIWSDKIRRASTYGTWAVLFMNIIALFLAQAIFEPRKRRKIVDGVEERLAVAMDEQQARMGDIGQTVELRLDNHESSIGAIATQLASVSAALASIAARQETELSVLGSQPAVDKSDFISFGGGGYSDTELDMYYAQQAQDARPRQLVPESMIWRVVQRPQRSQGADGQTFSRAQAGQLALESATLAGLLVAGLASAYLTFTT